MRLSLENAPLKVSNPATRDPVLIAALPDILGNPAPLDAVCSPPFMKGGDSIAVKAPGLPNLNGQLRISTSNNVAMGCDNSSNGVFYPIPLSNTDGVPTAATTTKINHVGFDASRSNAIYGSSDTVQPPALSLLPQFRF